MFRTITFIIALAGAGVAVVDHSASTEIHRVVDHRPDISEHPDHAPARPVADTDPTRVHPSPLTEAQQELVDWARGRFTEAGLELPEMVVRFDPTRELCGHAEGRFVRDADGSNVVTICTRDSDTYAAQLDRKRTLLHELGHAWDTANLDSGRRAEIAAVLGVDDWYAPDAMWADRGVERFAETFVFSLLDQPARQVKAGVACADLVNAFSMATGAVPLGPDAPTC